VAVSAAFLAQDLLRHAVALGPPGVLAALLDDADCAAAVNSLVGASTPLGLAAAQGRVCAMRQLLARGASVAAHACGAWGLLRAAHAGHHGAVRLLLDLGVDPNGGKGIKAARGIGGGGGGGGNGGGGGSGGGGGGGNGGDGGGGGGGGSGNAGNAGDGGVGRANARLRAQLRAAEAALRRQDGGGGGRMPSLAELLGG
jgi:hypothetical protein